jgi:hypothetical protein
MHTYVRGFIKRGSGDPIFWRGGILGYLDHPFIHCVSRFGVSRIHVTIRHMVWIHGLVGWLCGSTHKIIHLTQNPGSRVQGLDPGHRPDPGSRDHVSQGHRPWIQVTDQGVIQGKTMKPDPETGYQIPRTIYQDPETNYQKPDTRSRVQGPSQAVRWPTKLGEPPKYRDPVYTNIPLNFIHWISSCVSV